MQWIFRFLLQHRTITTLAITVMLSLWMINAPRPMQLSVARALTFTVFYPFQLVLLQANRVRNIFAENKRLTRQVTALTTEVMGLREAARENVRLHELVNFESTFPYALVPARVVGRDPAYPCRSIVVTGGTDKKLQAYMPIVNVSGVVGRTIAVFSHLSLVQLVTDPSSRISVMIARGRVVGIFETENGRDFFMRCRTHADVAPGDTVVTSGLGGIYPPGLLLGRVAQITDRNDPLFKKVFIKPAVDFDYLEDVCALRLAPQWASFRQELDSLGRKP
ncbi:MAG: rod shape-determining protein MreC [Chitinivibrionales bacterium]|nr:rod shape-determining protein MreC [Chitinivibrionales bacterium]